MAQRNRFSRRLRIRRSEDFVVVFDNGQVASDATLVVHAVKNQDSPTRLGLSVSKRAGNAVARNRWKRLIREAFRINYADLPSNLSIVVRPRKDAVPDAKLINESLVRLSRRLSRRLG